MYQSIGAKVSSLVVDADLNLGSTYKLKVDHIAESTASHTVVHDNPATGLVYASALQDGFSDITGTDAIITQAAQAGGNDSVTMVEAYRIWIPAGYGTSLKVAFDLSGSSGITQARGQIYLNGASKGTLRSVTGTTPTTYTETVDVSPGGYLSIYAATANAPGNGYGLINNTKLLGTKGAVPWRSQLFNDQVLISR